MDDPTIICPECKAEIKLTDSLAAPLIADARRDLTREFDAKTATLTAREAAIQSEEERVKAATASLEEQVAARLNAERATLAAAARLAAQQEAADVLREKEESLRSATERLAEQDAKLVEAQKAQTNYLQKARELEDAKREIDLTVEKRVQVSLTDVRDKAKLEAEQSLGLKVREKDLLISGMQQQIEDLKRKAEQGSQQVQGEVQELELESILRQKFPHDSIEPVPKGEFGGDLLQKVFTNVGQSCGTILWEAKRTKNWSDGWLTKLRDDQRAARADVALIISHALPKGTQSFDLVDGVWVAEPRCAIPVAIAIRQTLIQVAGTRVAGEGQQTKTEMVYNYLIGPRFRHRVEAIVERFSEMQTDLDRERKAMTRLWAKREAQISGVIEATAGMYGDLQGIAGRSLAEIEGLEMPLLDERLDDERILE